MYKITKTEKKKCIRTRAKLLELTKIQMKIKPALTYNIKY